MEEFLNNLITTWWGILIIVLASLIFLFLFSMIFYKLFMKRVYDILLSGLALIIFSPIYILLLILVRAKLGSPVIFKQLRPGKKGKIFKMHKFRTMTNEKDAEGNLLPDEYRMTKFGKLLRSTSLDELPEIWDIFRGKMSIIGPRPQLVKDLVFMDEKINERHKVRGGLTGLAQVSGRNNSTWDERFEHDLYYVKNLNLFLDIKIFFMTIFKVLKRSDVATEGMETSEDYGDYLLRLERINQNEYDEKIILKDKLLEEYK